MSTTKVNATADFVAGNFGGMANVIVGQPLDTIKVRLQLHPGRFKGGWDCAVQTVQKEGFSALYKGMASPLVGIGAVNALLFAANAYFKQRLEAMTPGQTLPLKHIALAGAGAGLVNSVLASPVELVKIKMQAQFGSKAVGEERHFKGPMECVRHLVQQEGLFRGLFRGLWATVVREMPAYAGFYSGFEVTKRYLTAHQQEQANVVQLMVSGAVGGVSYWLCCYPLDVVKSVIQHQALAPRGFYVTSVMKEIVQQDGYRGLFRGLGPTLLRSIPAAGATFTAYELCIRAYPF
ncbi:mitochondrial carrier [Spinellus fusiger]|nr:mitochondrial carrier [Spinellus fusiger]